MDSLVIAEAHDSAYQTLIAIDERDITTDADRAHYNLLKVQTSYLADKPIPNDSLIDTVISYYEQHVSHEKLADAYYYKADLLCEKHAFQEAIAFYKQAEHESLPDVMVTAMPTIAQAHYVVKFGRKHGIPVLVDLRDLNPDVFVSPFRGLMRQCVKIGIKPLQWMLGNALKHADGLIGTTEPYLNWGLNYAKRPKGDNDRVFFVSYSDSGVPTKLNNEDKWGKYLGYEGIVCCYFGQFGRLIDFDTVIDAASCLNTAGVK